MRGEVSVIRCCPCLKSGDRLAELHSTGRWSDRPQRPAPPVWSLSCRCRLPGPGTGGQSGGPDRAGGLAAPDTPSLAWHRRGHRARHTGRASSCSDSQRLSSTGPCTPPRPWRPPPRPSWGSSPPPPRSAWPGLSAHFSCRQKQIFNADNLQTLQKSNLEFLLWWFLCLLPSTSTIRTTLATERIFTETTINRNIL